MVMGIQCLTNCANNKTTKTTIWLRLFRVFTFDESCFDGQIYNNSALGKNPDISKHEKFHIYVKCIEKIHYLCAVKYKTSKQ